MSPREPDTAPATPTAALNLEDLDVTSLSDLGFARLRDYRNWLKEEEDKVSYWRRLIQARIDVLKAERRHLDGLTLRELATALGTTGTGARRKQLLSVHANDDLPPLPGLEELWTAAVDPANENEVRRVNEALSRAERLLTEYRTALHQRLDAATDELIERYRADPDLSLHLLPG